MNHNLKMDLAEEKDKYISLFSLSDSKHFLLAVLRAKIKKQQQNNKYN